MMLDWFILILIILMAAIMVFRSGEIYMYLVLTLGSLMADIQDKIKSIIIIKKKQKKKW